MSEMLPRDLVWEGGEGEAGQDGAAHLSEIALTAIADGEEAILPADARAHIDTCDACARKLGEAAMLSSAIGAALRGPDRSAAITTTTATVSAALPVAPARVSSRPRARLPMGPIAAGLGLAVFGAVPMILDLPVFLADARMYATHGLPIVMRSGVSFARAGGFDSAGLVLTLASAFVLVVASLLLVRRLPSHSASPSIATEGVL